MNRRKALNVLGVGALMPVATFGGLSKIFGLGEKAGEYGLSKWGKSFLACSFYSPHYNFYHRSYYGFPGIIVNDMNMSMMENVVRSLLLECPQYWDYEHSYRDFGKGEVVVEKEIDERNRQMLRAYQRAGIKKRIAWEPNLGRFSNENNWGWMDDSERKIILLDRGIIKIAQGNAKNILRQLPLDKFLGISNG